MNGGGGVMDDIKVICPCKGIRKKVFKKLIADGERSIDRILAVTGATTGDCKGRRCGPRIEEILKFTPR